jgi:hypothetical protein
LYTAPSGAQVVVLGLAIANKTTSAVSVKVQFTDTSASTTHQLLEDVSIPANTTLETLAGQKYILESTDVLKVQAGTGSALDIVPLAPNAPGTVVPAAGTVELAIPPAR